MNRKITVLQDKRSAFQLLSICVIPERAVTVSLQELGISAALICAVWKGDEIKKIHKSLLKKERAQL